MLTPTRIFLSPRDKIFVLVIFSQNQRQGAPRAMTIQRLCLHRFFLKIIPVIHITPPPPSKTPSPTKGNLSPRRRTCSRKHKAAATYPQRVSTLTSHKETSPPCPQCASQAHRASTKARRRLRSPHKRTLKSGFIGCVLHTRTHQAHNS
jgi:hypothetical protein